MIPFFKPYKTGCNIHGKNLHHKNGEHHNSRIAGYEKSHTFEDMKNILKNWPENLKKPNTMTLGGREEGAAKIYLKKIPIDAIESYSSFPPSTKYFRSWIIEWKDAADEGSEYEEDLQEDADDNEVDTTAASLGIPIAEWLTKITGSESIHAYAEAFADYGYTDTHVLMALTKVDLQECMEQIGVKPAHMKLILRAFEKMI